MFYTDFMGQVIYHGDPKVHTHNIKAIKVQLWPFVQNSVVSKKGNCDTFIINIKQHTNTSLWVLFFESSASLNILHHINARDVLDKDI